MDIFILLGPSPSDVSRQYSHLTGSTPLPPHFSIAYHQCRWNYNDQEDVRDVANNFDFYDIPMVRSLTENEELIDIKRKTSFLGRNVARHRTH